MTKIADFICSPSKKVIVDLVGCVISILEMLRQPFRPLQPTKIRKTYLRNVTMTLCEKPGFRSVDARLDARGTYFQQNQDRSRVTEFPRLT